MNELTEEKLNKIKEEFKGNLVDYIDKLKQKAELADHYKHLYSEVKKQKDDVVEYIKGLDGDYDLELANCVKYKIFRMLGEIDD